MNCIVLGLSCVILAATAISGIEGLNCLYGDTTKSVSRPCPGSCLTMEVPAGKFLECLPKRMQDGCKDVYGVKMCFCNTDDCNNGKGTSKATFIEFMAGANVENERETSAQTDVETRKGTKEEELTGTNIGSKAGVNTGLLFRLFQYQLRDLGENKM